MFLVIWIGVLLCVEYEKYWHGQNPQSRIYWGFWSAWLGYSENTKIHMFRRPCCLIIQQSAIQTTYWWVALSFLFTSLITVNIFKKPSRQKCSFKIRKNWLIFRILYFQIYSPTIFKFAVQLNINACEL